MDEEGFIHLPWIIVFIYLSGDHVSSCSWQRKPCRMSLTDTRTLSRSRSNDVDQSWWRGKWGERGWGCFIVPIDDDGEKKKRKRWWWREEEEEEMMMERRGEKMERRRGRGGRRGWSWVHCCPLPDPHPLVQVNFFPTTRPQHLLSLFFNSLSSQFSFFLSLLNSLSSQFSLFSNLSSLSLLKSLPPLLP